jgi:hypothetical protein
MSKKLSLSEMMGSAAAGGGLRLSNLHDVLGHLTPDLPRNEVGRYRLITALHQRFGPGYRSLPGVNDLFREFDGDVEHEEKKRKLAAIRYEPPKSQPKKGK